MDPKTFPTTSEDRTANARAMLELTDANISPAAAEAWDTAVDTARREAADEATPRRAELDTLVEAATACG